MWEYETPALLCYGALLHPSMIPVWYLQIAVILPKLKFGI